LIPLSAALGVQIANNQVDLVVLGILATPSDVGIYRIAATLATQLNLGLLVMSAVATPRYARLYREGSIDALMALNRTCVSYALGFGALVFLAYLLVGKPVISIVIGAAYEPAFVPLVILCLAYLATMWAGQTNVILNMTGHERDVLYCAVLSLVVNLILNILLVPPFGMIGAASATTISLLAWRAGLVHFVKKRIPGY
jgi:O-antigen/teichoic acid export membrane protein